MIARKVNSEELDAFYKVAHENASAFSSREWHDQFGQDLDVIAVFEDNQIVAGCALAKLKLKGFSTLAAPVFTPHIGWFEVKRSNNPSAQISRHKKLITALISYLNSRKEKIHTLPFPCDVIDLQPFAWENYKLVSRLTYQIDLTQSEEELFSNVHSKTRNVIRKGESDGLSFEFSENADEVAGILQKSMARNSVEGKDAVLSKFLNLSPQLCKKAVAKINGKAIAAAVIVFDETSCYYILGGYDSAQKHTGAGAFLIWNLILWSRNRGLRIFDFEGSSIPAVEKFFRGFGGSQRQFLTANKASFLLETALKLKKRSSF